METIVISGPPVIAVASPGPPGVRGPQGIQGLRGPKGDAGTGAGSSTPSVQVRIKVELITLPNTGGWQVVRTSPGTGSVPLQASIAAEVGDRIWADVTAMRTGGGTYMDLAALKADGAAISEYGGSGDATPLPEGDPEFYPDIGTLPSATGTVEFVVQAEQIDADGMVTIAQVCAGAGGGTETLYASSTYPWRLLIRNAGPQPG